MPIASGQFTIFDSNDVLTQATLPETPVENQLVAYTGVTPNELLRWTGKGVNPTARRYAASKEGPVVPIEDLSGSDDRDLGVTVKTKAKQTVTARGQNDCPPVLSGRWSLANGAYIDAENYIVLPNPNSIAIILLPWKKRSGNMIPGATFQCSGANGMYLMSLFYLDAFGNELTSYGNNGAAAYIGSTSPTWKTQPFWDNGVGEGYSDSRRNCYFVRWHIQRDATYATQSYRFKDPYFGAVDAAAPVGFVPESPSPWYPALFTPAVAAGGNANAKRCGKNLFDSAPVTQSGCVSLGNGSFRVNLNPGYYAYLGITDATIIEMFLRSGGKTFTFSCSGNPSDTWLEIVIMGNRAGISSYQAVQGSVGGNSVSITIATDFLSISAIEVRFARKGVTHTDITSVVSNFQCEVGDTATAYEPYAATDCALPVQQTMYDLTGLEDERGSDGHEMHKTAIVELPSIDGVWWEYGIPANGTTVFSCDVLAVDMATGYQTSRCSHFANIDAIWDNGGASVGYSDHPTVMNRYFRVPLAVIGATPSDDTPTKLQKWRDWILAQHVAGTPVQLVYKKATPTTVSNPETPITGVDGTNTITSDGAAVLVNYTGSGWAKMGETSPVSISDAAALSKLVKSITQDERGLIITGVGDVFTLILGPEEIQFWQTDEKVAYISSRKMYIGSAELVAEMRIGNYILKATADGGLVFM